MANPTILSTTGTQTSGRRSDGVSRKTSVLLWSAQALLALIFLSTGGSKLMTSSADLAHLSGLPGPFMRFIGVCELLGAIGLILPALLRIRPSLTPLAAAALVIIMIGATIDTVAQNTVALALLPFVVGVVAASIAYGRARVAPISGHSRLRLPGTRRARRADATT